MRFPVGLVGAALCALLLGSAQAQVDPRAHGGTPASGSTPHEAGQAAFVAISEIVDLLSADPATDWSKVNIDALRDHLVDMDNVLMRAKVVTTPVAGGARFDVSGDGPVAASIQRMVAGQTRMLNGRDGLSIESSPTASGATLTVTAIAPGDISLLENRIRALGFFGLITDGAHHQLHHLAIASGTMPH